MINESLFQLGFDNPIGVSLALIPALLNLGILAYVLRYLPRDRLTSVFAMFVFLLVAWQGFDVMVRAAITPEAAATWRGLLRVGQFLAIPAGVHFALLFSRADRVAMHPLTLGLLYVPPLIFEGFYSGGLIVERLEHRGIWGYITDPNLGPFNTFLTVWMSVLVMLIPVILYWNWWQSRLHPGRAAASRILAIGITIPTLIGVFTEAIMPQLLGIKQVPLVSTNLSIFSAATVYALARHGMFRVSTLSAAQAVLETVSDSLIIARADGRLLFANVVATQTFDLDENWVQRHLLSDLFPSSEDANRFLEGPWKQTLSGTRHAGLDLALLAANGRPLPALISTAPIPISRTGPPGVVVIVHDITAIKEAEEALALALDTSRMANKAKSLFLANMSHELRTPLNAIIGYAQMLAEDAEDDGADDLVSDLGRIETSGAYLLGLINDILDLSKVESGKLELRTSNFDLLALTREVEPMLNELCRKNGNQLQIRHSGEITVHADRTRVHQVLLNLCSNAAKFTDAGTISVVIGTEDGHAVLDVIDTGIGMDAEQIEQLFGLFTQVHTTGHDKFGGTGLGLALSRRLCRLMDGDITAHSEPGKGSRFRVILPISAAMSAT